MTDAAPQPESRRAAPFPGAAAALAALRALTIVGGGRAPLSVDASALYYPLVGLLLGVLWVIADRALGAVTGRVGASAAVVLVATAATGARPARALARTLAALVSGRAQRLAILERGGRGSAALLAAVLALEVGVLTALSRYRLVGLAFAPVLGCCSMVVIAVGSRAARADGRRLKFAPAVTFREFGLASTATFALLFLSTDFLGLLLVLTTAVCAIAARVFFHRWIDGVNETVMLATGEAVQIVVIALLAAFS